MRIEDWRLDRIIPYAGNPRKRSKKAVTKVAASIREFGVRQPIVVDEAGVILVGHTRRDAAASLGLATFPVHQALGLNDAQKRAYRIADIAPQNARFSAGCIMNIAWKRRQLSDRRNICGAQS